MIRAFLVSYRINNDSFCVSRPIIVHDNVPFLQFFRTTLRKPLRSSSKPILLPSNDATWIIIPIARYLKIFQNRSTIPSISNKFKYRSRTFLFNLSLSHLFYYFKQICFFLFSFFIEEFLRTRRRGTAFSRSGCYYETAARALYTRYI